MRRIVCAMLFLVTGCAQKSTTLPVSDCLEQHPTIKNALRLQGHPYDQWPSSIKQKFNEFYRRASLGQPSGLKNPPPNSDIRRLNGKAVVTQKLWIIDAQNLYLATVAHCLIVEHDRKVGWSVKDLSPEELAVLFDSDEYFDRFGEMDIWEHGGRSIPPPPDIAWVFLQDKIGPTRLDSIVAVVEWLRRCVHFSGHATFDTMLDHWQYPGFPPVTRVISGTRRYSDGRFAHFAAGCHGTTGFLRNTLRLLNIPVMPVRAAGHSLPHFPTERLYMSHGDDPYNAMVKNEECISARELLIDETTFREWFPGDDGAGVGRTPRELAIKYLVPYLLKQYCLDLMEGRSHEEGRVNKLLKDYTCEELEKMRLWERMDQKLSGGCDGV